MKDLVVGVATAMIIGFVIGGIKASGPHFPAPAVPAPPLPQPGAYTVIESTPESTWPPYDWTLSDCGPECVHVLSQSSDNRWQLELSWSSTADANRGAWVGERTNPGMSCKLGAPEEYRTGPFTMKYIIRPDLTGFINMKFSQDNPSCSGDTDMRSRELTLRKAPTVWS
ncbi:hypothetical protein [Mycolicibacterium sp. XJ870]